MPRGGSGSRGWATGVDGSKSDGGGSSVSSSGSRWAAGHGGSVSSGGGQEAASAGNYVSRGVDGWAASGGRSFVSSVGDGRPAGNDMAAIAAVRHDEFDFVTGLVDFDAETEDQQLMCGIIEGFYTRGVNVHCKRKKELDGKAQIKFYLGTCNLR